MLNCVIFTVGALGVLENGSHICRDKHLEKKMLYSKQKIIISVHSMSGTLHMISTLILETSLREILSVPIFQLC